MISCTEVNPCKSHSQERPFLLAPVFFPAVAAALPMEERALSAAERLHPEQLLQLPHHSVPELCTASSKELSVFPGWEHLEHSFPDCRDHGLLIIELANAGAVLYSA